MLVGRLSWTAGLLALVALSASPARAADSSKDARKVYQEATAAFGLGRYAEAAEKYEAAFALKPDPALLYNAAQSYRLAGNKQRAFDLYQNYVRLYSDSPKAEDARNHAAALKKAMDQERQAGAGATTPPAPVPTAPPPAAAPVTAPAPPPASPAPAPVASMPPPVVTPIPQAPPPSAATTPLAPAAPPPAADPAPAPLAGDPNVPSVTQTSLRAQEGEPFYTRTWFWVAVGAVVVGGTIGVLLATRGEEFPNPSFGTAPGN